MKYTIPLTEVNLSHVHLVGGKNASTGEMLQNLLALGVKVPSGFAITTSAYDDFITHNKLDEKIAFLLRNLRAEKIAALKKASLQIEKWIIKGTFSRRFELAVKKNYQEIRAASLAVRSSAITEDLNNASFAGMQRTLLNVRGYKNLLQSIKLVYASVYTPRALAYRIHQQFDHQSYSISVGIQPMIRSDKSVSGVMFTLDTESGFDKVILINAAYGLGESIVQGIVNPDEFIVYKEALKAKHFAILQKKLGTKAIKMVYTQEKNPEKSIKTINVPIKDRLTFCLSNHEIEHLAQSALLIEKHYDKPMDIEWAKDGITGEIYIVQARPETVMNEIKNKQQMIRYELTKKSTLLAKGQSVGQKIGKGKAHIILDPKKIHTFKKGDVLVTDMTDPDWEPVMKLASAIVTNRGGRTCHAAIIARELGVPAVVGCENATKTIKNHTPVTVSCAEGQIGYIYAGYLPFEMKKISIKELPKIPIKLCMNIGNAEKAFNHQFLPNDGVGLARLEFIIESSIGIHPNAALNFHQLRKPLQKQIKLKTAAYKNPTEFYIEKLREGIAMIAAAFYPKEVIFRFSDFKSNEYANLLGGHLYEPYEENPMIGFRGAARYNDGRFKLCFALECEAFRRVREEMNLTNAVLMIPFVRTVNELKEVITLIENHGLKRDKNGLKIYMMCEVPSNIILATQFLEHVDGFSIGSNDLTQLTLGLDRDSQIVAHLFDERNEAIKSLLSTVISICKQQKKYIGICGQGPSDHPDFAEWLVNEGIQCMSLNPDTIVQTWLRLGEKFNS